MGRTTDAYQDGGLEILGGATTSFVGREPQLQQLERFLQEAIDGRPRLVLLLGEAGIGKTRLLRELRSRASRRDTQVLYGRCHEDLGLPYLPFEEALRPQFEEPREDVDRAIDADRQFIAQVLLHKAPATISEQPASSESDLDRLRLFLAMSRLVIGLARLQPIVLLLDDLHWADGSSLSLFSHLIFAVAEAAAQGPLPILIIGTYRPIEPGHDLSRVIARLQREEICESVELSGLSEPEMHQLLRALGLARPSQQLASTISQATGGNPLFIQEVLHHLVNQGALQERAGYLMTTVSPSAVRLPEHLTTAIADHAKGLSENCRKALLLASFLGDSFQLEILSAVSEKNEDELLDIVEEAMGQRLLLSEGETFQFAHPLIRHVFYNEPSAVRRRRIHRQIAETLERVYIDRLDDRVLEIAHHLVCAGPIAEPEKVAEYAHRAGDQALAVFAWGEAARYYEAALAAAESCERLSPHDQAELHYLAGFAYYRDLDVGPCQDHYERAIESFRKTGDTAGVTRALTEKMRVGYTLNAVPFGTLVDPKPLDDVLKSLGDREPRLRGRALHTMSGVYFHARQPQKAEEMAQRALEIGEEINDDRLSAEATAALALTHMQSLQLVEALEDLDKSLAFLERVGDPWLLCWPLVRKCSVLISLGRLREAERLAREAGDATSRVHHWAEYSLVLAYRVAISYHRGDFSAVERYAAQGMAAAHRSHYPWGPVVFLPTLAYTHCLRGDFNKAEDSLATLAEAGQIFEDPGQAVRAMTAVGAMTLIYRALIKAMSGESEESEKLIKPILPMVSQFAKRDIHTVPSCCALAETAGLLDEREVARAQYEPLLFARQQGALLCPSWGFLTPRVLGLIAAVNRWWDKAEDHYREAIEEATRIEARPELGRSYLDYARMLAARRISGDRKHAIDLVGQASSIFDDLNMEPFIRQAEQLGESLQTRVGVARRRRAAYPDNLSEREVEILLLIARGHTNKLIADQLVLSPKTVDRHVSNIFNKIEVDNRTAATAYAFEKGLTSPVQPLATSETTSQADSTAREEKARREYRPTPPTQPPLSILITDMESSTALTQRLGDAKAQELLRTHNAIIRDCLRAHVGSEIKHTGDGIMASFASASGAIGCAIAVQRGFAEHNRKRPPIPITVRIGLNAGEPVVEEEDLFGTVVQAAARIAARARPGRILVSDVIRQLAAGKGFAFVDRGRVSLKGFPERFRLHEVQWEVERG